VHVLAFRQRNHAAGQGCPVKLQPVRDPPAQQVERAKDGLHLAAALTHSDFLPRRDLKGGDIDFAPRHQNVPVPDQLARRGAGSRQAQTVDHIVQPPLKHREQGRARNALHGRSLFVIGAELVLENTVETPRLLLLPKLQAVTHQLGPTSLAVLARSKVAALDGALVRQAALALQKELHSLPATEPANRVTVSRQTVLHFKVESQNPATRRGPSAFDGFPITQWPDDPRSSDSPALRRPTPVMRDRCHVLDVAYLQARRRQRPDGRFPTRAGAFDAHFDASHSVVARQASRTD